MRERLIIVIKGELIMKSILVTGGAGFIGSHLVEKLSLEKKYDISVFDNLSIGSHNTHLLKKFNVDFVKGNVESSQDVSNIKNDIDIIFHLAAMNRAPRSIKDPLKSNEVNITGTLNILEFARKNDSRVIFASSSSVFGHLDIMPRPENSYEFLPSHPYGLGKMTSEHYCRIYRELYGLDTIVVRYFSIFGPRQTPKLTYSAVIPKFINSIINNQSITIFGGSQSRNFTYVKDAVDATLLPSLAKTTKYKLYQIGGYKEISVNQLANELEKISGKKVIRKFKENQKGDISRSIPKMDHLIDEFKFSPRFTLYEALKETYNWFMNNQNYFS